MELYGDIYDETPIDWWTGEPVENAITVKSFREAIEPYKDSPHITIHLNSGGGDLYSGITIHNLINELPGKTTVVIDAMAASAASLIAAAADEVLVYPSSVYMVHDGYMYLEGWYTPEELEKSMRGFDSSHKAMLAIYQQKSGLPLEEIEELVRAETYMTGQEIVDMKFADRLIATDLSDVQDDLDKLSEDLETIIEEGEITEEEIVAEDPDEEEIAGEDDPEEEIVAEELSEEAMQELEAAQDVVEEIEEAISEIEQEDAQQEAKLIRLFAKRCPNIAASLFHKGVMNERKRIAEIDSIAQGIDPKLVQKAKYKKPMTAQRLAYQSLKARKSSASVLSGMMNDARSANRVRSSAVMPEARRSDDAEADALMAEAVKAHNARR